MLLVDRLCVGASTVVTVMLLVGGVACGWGGSGSGSGSGSGGSGSSGGGSGGGGGGGVGVAVAAGGDHRCSIRESYDRCRYGHH